MEKFSAFRDPGTGIQPFLKPVPPTGSETLTAIALPFGYVVGTVRTLLVLISGVLYVVLVEGVCLALKPVPPLHRIVTLLLILGLPWIPVEMVTRKRGRGSKAPEPWSPGAGDIIVSNWASTIEILWLAFRVFRFDFPEPSARVSSPVARTPGRRTGTGSAAISSPAARAPTPRVPIAGFKQVSLFGILRATGHVPDATQPGSPGIKSLEEIRSNSDRPVVVFPECATSNGRGLLRFAEIFKGVSVPVTKFKVFVMCVRYDPPTALSPTMTHSIPSNSINPIPQLFSLTTSLVPLTMSIRLLAPSESPSSGSFLASEFLTEGTNDDYLTEACASLIAQIGKMKRVGFGWEDKAAFLEFYNSKK
ncbi:uncharacterized protein B0H18DRAFT_1091228 [Fomitopsis serialis]|uniref:uncharacterized protein n=1 Tax=Fomitopsis serialis TaxID=139415 RepID=UPI002008E86D|nr:uncharacterized protein B0H18DRAFT_1091228 [Neoantrodia serialis]KAH9938565.1 hypothetical protein B0H18DRAFT_1091228 [Neoantrodia serialis]